MFRAVPCSSSGGPIVSPQPLVSSLSVNSRTVCRLRADCRFYAAVRSTNLLVKCGFDLVKKFVINLIIISAFLPPVLPPSSNCALSVYCCIPVPTYQQGLTALTCESINWLEWKGTSPYIQREKRIIPVNKLIFNNHNIINAGCLDLSSCFIFSAFFFFSFVVWYSCIWGRSKYSPCENCGVQNGIVTDVYLPVLQFSPLRIIPQMLYIRFHLNVILTGRPKERGT